MQFQQSRFQNLRTLLTNHKIITSIHRALEPEDTLKNALEIGNNFPSPSLLQEPTIGRPPRLSGHAHQGNLDNQERENNGAVMSPPASQVRHEGNRERRGTRGKGGASSDRDKRISSTRQLPSRKAQNL